jgi:anti-repressor protein
MEGGLIRIEPLRIDGRDVFGISARDVHRMLEVGSDFSTWIKGRITKYSYIEGKDYIVSLFSGKTPSGHGKDDDSEPLPHDGQKSLGGRPPIEYMITTDMALDLALIEGTPAALEFKRALIARLDAARKDAAPARSYDDMLEDRDFVRALANHLNAAQAKVGLLEAKIEADAPKLAWADSVAPGRDMTVRDFSIQLLGDEDVNTGEIRLYRWMREVGLVVREPGSDYNHPVNRVAQKGWLRLLPETRIDRWGRECHYDVTMVTPLGQIKIREMFRNAAGLPLEGKGARRRRKEGLSLVPAPGGLFRE